MTQVDMQARGRTWPKMAVHSPHMTGRGARIKLERKRRRLSQMDLHKLTGVGLRTIGRIEAGEAENSPSLDILEAYFGIDTLPAADRDDTPTAGAGVDGDPDGLERYTTTELLAEALRRIAHLEAAVRGADTPPPPPRPLGTVRWSTADAPSARRDHAEQAREGETPHGQ